MRKTIWAPWRMDFIIEAQKKSRGCLFCQIPRLGVSQKNLVLYADKDAYVVLNRYPYTIGHLLVIPKRHVAQFSQIKPKEHQKMGELIASSIKALKKGYRAQGFNIGLNIGAVAGAGIKKHIHYHVIPRWRGDSNCLPILSDARLVSEHIRETYKRLVKYFR